MSKKSQSSFEMLVTFMIAITILVPTVIYVMVIQSDYADSYRISVSQNVVNKLGEAADSIFLQGTPAKLTLTLQFPDGIKEITVEDDIILITLTTKSGQTEIFRNTKETVTGTLPTTSGIYKIVVENQGDRVSISRP